ncbi:TatD family hydrolase [Reichenbachiella versicolor]|uniref:TatD family hydrolase n=1 Tax=Reichenbachiella versicolor TaxID=1821036 RepID=UPI001FEA3B11|nr:TatD family hydrolase [Reichenbachiella versicolor]
MWYGKKGPMVDNNQFVETHAHIYSSKFKEDIADVIERSQEAGVSKIYMPNVDHESIDGMLELENKYPEYCIPMMGLHPCSVKKDFEKELYIVEDWLSKRPFVAVGEIGTDLYWDKSLFELQKEAFIIQCNLANQNDIPVIIHCRESIDETIEILEGMANAPKGIFHCFTGDVEQAKRIIALGHKIGIGGVATFKNGGLDPVLLEIDLENMVLETDCPYLAPTPYRGKRNEPAFIELVAQKISDLKNIPVSEVAQSTTNSALQIFKS